jgi:hypothetical protein
VNQSQAVVKSDQHHVDALTKAVAAAKESNKDSLQQQLDLAQAQLAMDTDELDDAKQDLARAGGDLQSKIQRLLDEHENSQQAEQEWQRINSRYKVKSVSALPAINVRPTTSGVEVLIRYITRAHERFAVRAKLYQSIVALLHQKHADGEPATQPMSAAQ